MDQRDFEKITNALRELSELVYNLAQEEKERKTLNNKRLFLLNEEPTRATKLKHVNFDSSSTEELELERLHVEQAKKILFELKGEATPADAGNNVDSQLNNEEQKGTFQFTEKEIRKMPKLKDLSYRFKEKGKVHEFRYRRNGVNRSFSSKVFADAKQKAMDFINELNGFIVDELSNRNAYFNSFAIGYMRNVKKVNVSAGTYAREYNRLENHILPLFKNMKLKDVNAPFLQKILNDVIAKGNYRTAEGMYYLLKSILDYAENTELIRKNPLKLVKIPLHVRQNGVALPQIKEKELIKAIVGDKYELHFLIFLYTGCRPCELYTLAFERDGFITFRNMKQKNGKVAFKDVPITPMLEPYIDRIKHALPLQTNTELAKRFSKIMTGYKMYSLRHTFATRCQECGVPEEVVQKWMGHAGNTLLGKVYTHYTDNFMLEQAQKVRYTL